MKQDLIELDKVPTLRPLSLCCWATEGGRVSYAQMNDRDLLKGIPDSTIIYWAPVLCQVHSYLFSPCQPRRVGLLASFYR